MKRRQQYRPEPCQTRSRVVQFRHLPREVIDAIVSVVKSRVAPPDRRNILPLLHLRLVNKQIAAHVDNDRVFWSAFITDNRLPTLRPLVPGNDTTALLRRLIVVDFALALLVCALTGPWCWTNLRDSVASPIRHHELSDIHRRADCVCHISSSVGCLSYPTLVTFRVVLARFPALLGADSDFCKPEYQAWLVEWYRRYELARVEWQSLYDALLLRLV